MGVMSGEINVLLIEDNLDNAKMLIKMLSKDEHVSFKVDHEETLYNSLKVLSDNECDYDVILLDLVLSNSEGINTYKKVREACDDLPIVIVSGFEDIACKCVKLGAQDYILKTDLTPRLITRSLKYAIERKKLHLELIESQERFKLLSRANFEGVAVTRDGIFIDANEQFLEMIGCSYNELIGEKVITFVAEEDIGVVENHLEKQSEDPYEHTAKRKDGTEFPVEIHGANLPDGLRLTAVRNMTRYKNAERDLKLSQEKYKELVEVTKAAIYEIDLIENKFIYVNDVLCDLTGWSKEEFKSIKPTNLLTDESLEQFLIRMNSLKKGKYIDPTFEYQVKVKDGSIKWTLITIKFKENDEGVVTSANVVAIDITDRKNAELQAKQKEEIIFSELENRLKIWKNEIVQTSLEQQDKIRIVSSNIQSITNGSEVIQ